MSCPHLGKIYTDVKRIVRCCVSILIYKVYLNIKDSFVTNFQVHCLRSSTESGLLDKGRRIDFNILVRVHQTQPESMDTLTSIRRIRRN